MQILFKHKTTILQGITFKQENEERDAGGKLNAFLYILYRFENFLNTIPFDYLI